MQSEVGSKSTNIPIFCTEKKTMQRYKEEEPSLIIR